MKKLKIIITIIGLVGLFSCTKDEPKPTIVSPADSPILNLTPNAEIILLKANQDTLINYTWVAANYGIQVVTTYSLQIDRQGNDFADAVTIGTINSATSISVLTSALNAALLAMEADPAVPNPLAVEFRLQTFVPNYPKDTVFSAAVPQTITPYYVLVTYPLLGVPGNYQSWNPADSSTTIASLKSNGKYDGYINFTEAATEFKFTQGPSWDNNWGDDGADGTLNPNGANITAEAGYYKLHVDLPALTYTKLKTTWGLIGDATPGGWDADTPMTYDATAKVWTVTVDLTAAKIKFRANGNWDLNYGDNGGNGSLEEGGADISVPSAGNYTVKMNLSGAIYTYQLIKN
jgi:starch-binding outer membrane protein SusE/F